MRWDYGPCNFTRVTRGSGVDGEPPNYFLPGPIQPMRRYLGKVIHDTNRISVVHRVTGQVSGVSGLEFVHGLWNSLKNSLSGEKSQLRRIVTMHILELTSCLSHKLQHADAGRFQAMYPVQFDDAFKNSNSGQNGTVFGSIGQGQHPGNPRLRGHEKFGSGFVNPRSRDGDEKKKEKEDDGFNIVDEEDAAKAMNLSSTKAKSSSSGADRDRSRSRGREKKTGPN